MNQTERAYNPFETEIGADVWINSVEGYDIGREELIYPRVNAWLSGLSLETTLADVGCGQGVCADFVPDSMNYIGFDPSSLLIQRAQELQERPNRHFLVSDAEHIALAGDSVDAALSVHVWFHLADLVEPSKELARIVRPGGEIFITTANPNGYSIWESWYSNKTEDGKMLRGTLGNADFATGESVFYRHSMDEILSALTEAGFAEPNVEEFGRFEKPTAMTITATKL